MKDALGAVQWVPAGFEGREYAGMEWNVLPSFPPFCMPFFPSFFFLSFLLVS